MDEIANPSVEALLAHAGWVRALARKLVLDPNEADDLAQETLTAALASRPRPGGGLASWLAATLANAKRQRWRREVSRVRNETLGARSERLPSTDELAEQADLQRALVEHVLALDEPYRGVLLQRWFAELQPAEIAARAKVPVGTVSSQLARAHQKLRERLERKHGGGNAWLSALLPLLPRPAALSVTTGALMNAKIILSAAALALVAGVFVWMRTADDAARGTASSASPTASLTSKDTSHGGGPLPADPGVLTERESLSHAPSSTPKADAAATPTIAHVRGSVLDSEGRALAGRTVGWKDMPEGRVQSGNQGRFELETKAAQGVIDVFDAGWTTVRSGAWRDSARTEPVVIVARAIDVGGWVQDEGGRRLAGARVVLAQPPGFAARFEGDLEATMSHDWRTLAANDGSFALAHVPAIEGATLRVLLEGYDATEIAEPAVSDARLAVTLRRPAQPLAGALHGRVVDDRGAFVPDARVFMGLASETTDEAGRFTLSLARAVTSDTISAIKSGFRPAFVERPRTPHGEDTGWPDAIELVLPGPALSIRGVVVDHSGHPCAGLRVSLADPTPVGTIGKMPTYAENLMAGARIPPLALDSEARSPKSDGDGFYDYYMHDLTPSAFWHWVPTDAEGRFEIGGLDDRRYRLRLMDPHSLDITTTDPYAAGSDAVRIALPAPDLLKRVAGRAIDDDGRPVPGVSIRIDAEAVGARSRVFGGNVYVTLREARESVKTDADGRFELKDVPRASIHLLVESERALPQELDLAEQKDPAAIEVRLHSRCSFQVQITSDVDADAVAVLDADGKQLDILILEAGSMNALTDVGLVDKHTAVVSTSSAAATLLLTKNGEVVKRTSIRLHPDGINRLEM